MRAETLHHRQSAADVSDIWRWLPSALIWAVVFISFRPFTTEFSDNSVVSFGGDIINQLGFGAVGAICLYLIYQRRIGKELAALLIFSWCAMALVLTTSVFMADNPTGAFRALAFSFIVIFAAFAAMVLLRSKNDLVSALSALACIVLAYCYFAVAFVPAQGIHSGGGFAPQHAGLWRGVFDHKNVASYVMGGLVIISLFIARNGRPLLGAFLLVLSIHFVLQAGSKTVLGVLPIAIATAVVANWVTWPFLRVLVLLLPLAALTFVTLGSVIHPPVLDWLREFVPDLSYTGRTDLWVFGLENLMKFPLTGYGFESFWATPRVTGLEQPIELSWDVRGIVHGHNSWLDAMIAFGIPGAIIVFLVVAVVPIRDYLRIPQQGNAGKIAGLFIGLWLLTALAANLESFFFRRADPVWFLMLISIIGLRITAHKTRQRRV